MSDDEIRDRLAEALPESLGPVSLRRPSPPLIPDGRPEPRGYGDHLIDALLPTVRAIVAEAREEGRKSVGLGDFMVITCDEEIRSPYVLDAYGEWLSCSRREGHDGEHEHSDSGYTWAEELP